MAELTLKQSMAVAAAERFIDYLSKHDLDFVVLEANKDCLGCRAALPDGGTLHADISRSDEASTRVEVTYPNEIEPAVAFRRYGSTIQIRLGNRGYGREPELDIPSLSGFVVRMEEAASEKGFTLPATALAPSP